MKPDLNVGANIVNPNFDVILEELDTDVKIGLILCDGQGKSDRRGIIQSAMPRTAMQLSQGGGSYDNYELPFTAESASTMIGGRGSDNFIKDKTRYADGFRMDTSGDKPICGPDIIPQSDYEDQQSVYDEFKAIYEISVIDNGNAAAHQTRNYTEYKNNSGKEQHIYGLSFYLTPSENYSGLLYFGIANSVNADSYSSFISLTDSKVVALSKNNSSWVYLPFSEPVSIPSNTTCYIGFKANTHFKTQIVSSNDLTFHGCKKNGSMPGYITNTEANTGLAMTLHEKEKSEYKFFEYKRCLYMLKTNRAANEGKGKSYLYRNGYRGVATSNAADRTKLNTTDLSGIDEESLAGAIALINNGKGEMDSQNWREITSNTIGTAEEPCVISVSEAWDTRHSDKADFEPTEYVILGTNKWTQIDINLPYAVTDWEIVNDYVVFAFGDTRNLMYYREWATQPDAGTAAVWSKSLFENDGLGLVAKYHHLALSQSLDGKLTLWAANANSCQVTSANLTDTFLEAEPKNAAYTGTFPNFDIWKEKREEYLRTITRLNQDKDKMLASAGYKYTNALLDLNRKIEDLEDTVDRAEQDLMDELTDKEARPFERAKADALKDIARINQDISNLQRDLFGDDIQTIDRAVEDATREMNLLKTYIIAGDTSSHITNMLIYGTPPQPFILKEGEIGSINENVYARIPLDEIKAVRSEVNGQAAMAYGVYLYFNLESGWIERYFDQQMTDVSPNKDEGLPTERQGEISKVMPYAGRWYAAIDAGFDGISSVLLNNELGWHEIYRSSKTGFRITDIYVQVIPGKNNPDYLWISEGQDMFAIPIGIAPLKQRNYRYYGQGKEKDQIPYVITSWIDFNYQDVNKYFHSLKLFVDMPTRQVYDSYAYNIYAWYKTDDMGPDEWIYIGANDSSRGAKEFLIVDKFGRQNVTGKQIKFKIAMKSNTIEDTPRLNAWVCNAVVRFETKYSWDLSFFLQPDTDLTERKILMKPNEIFDQLAKWGNSEEYPKPLRMRTNDPLSDGRLVFIDPVALKRTVAELRPNSNNNKKIFVNIGTLRIYEV